MTGISEMDQSCQKYRSRTGYVTPKLSECGEFILNMPGNGIYGRGKYVDILTECRTNMCGGRLGTLVASRRVNVASTFTPFPSSVDRQTGSERMMSIRGECRVVVGTR